MFWLHSQSMLRRLSHFMKSVYNVVTSSYHVSGHWGRFKLFHLTLQVNVWNFASPPHFTDQLTRSKNSIYISFAFFFFQQFINLRPISAFVTKNIPLFNLLLNYGFRCINYGQNKMNYLGIYLNTFP